MGKELCSVVIPPLSKVHDLIDVTVGELDAGFNANAVYIRPVFWENHVGLHPDTILPLVLNEYILDTRKNKPMLVEYDPEEPYKRKPVTKPTFVLSCYTREDMRGYLLQLFMWLIIIGIAFRLIFG